MRRRSEPLFQTPGDRCGLPEPLDSRFVSTLSSSSAKFFRNVTVRRARTTWLTAAACLATLLTTCLVVIRHRHAGDLVHSHAGQHRAAHSHSHSHSHSHGHSHPHRHAHVEHGAVPEKRHDGWHVHILILGWEITLWERGVEVASASSAETGGAAETPHGTSVLSGLQLVTSGGVSWCLLGLMLPLLGRPAFRRSRPLDLLSVALRETAFPGSRRRDRPPVPPPRWMAA
ncbi:hypothetical protein Pan44_45860 [Caulifigura coniformis]|uniref:Uncharacterized protein n=1 Tax=Caulifigura coniformis TaxID=2527983 RepID=A0A517SK82_9PLAN|nr:hypothetical protein Pan44_45860 [Caulifigura coniformis]